ncbi:SDR family NAD(P)-dependent oxidoreductase [Martelella sp. AMO21009]
MTIDLTNRVAIVTGAGGGLGRQHALALAKRGAKLVVNDLGGNVDGTGGSSAAAEAVVEEIRQTGGEAIANGASVTDYQAVEAMVAKATERFGSVDILVANAGILRDRSFAKMDIADFKAVLDVHVMGSVNCAKAVWEGMRDRGHGRIIFITSSTGLFGNFGQSNYGAAKMALVGLMNTLALEGAKYDIKVNCLAPSAGTRMLEGLIPEDQLKALDPALVSPAVVAMAAKDAPTRTIICAGAGSFEITRVLMSHGVHIGGADDAAEQILGAMDTLKSMDDFIDPPSGFTQPSHELTLAGFDTKKES